MPITKSAQKSLRQNKRRAIRNVKRKRKIKDLLKEVGKLISQNKAKEAEKLLPEIYKSLDKAAKTKVIKKNTASRKKSRITKAIIKQIK
jgi:small subunit ribosomal protein S20